MPVCSRTKVKLVEAMVRYREVERKRLDMLGAEYSDVFVKKHAISWIFEKQGKLD